MKKKYSNRINNWWRCIYMSLPSSFITLYFLYSYTVNTTILFDNHTTCFDHKGLSSGVNNPHSHLLSHICISQAITILVSGFVDNIYIHPIT
jgi:hypothetical protein